MHEQKLFHVQIEKQCQQTHDWRIALHYNTDARGIKVVGSHFLLHHIHSDADVIPIDMTIRPPSETDATCTDVDMLRECVDRALSAQCRCEACKPRIRS